MRELLVVVQYPEGVNAQGLCRVAVDGYRMIASYPLIGNRDLFVLQDGPPPAQQETTGNDQPTGPVSEASESPNKGKE
jgi:hypothetical protein